MTSLEGFGSADVTTPFHYGSVADGISHNPSLEQKLKKKYWKTKQTVIQKLNKSQDEFVVAGDADIDTKLEVRVIQWTLVLCVCGYSDTLCFLFLFLFIDCLSSEVLLSPTPPHA